MSNPVERFIQDTINGIRQGIDSINSRISSLPDAVKQRVAEQVNQINNGIEQWINEVRRQLESVLTSAHNITRDVINRVGSSIENVVNNTTANINNTINTIKTGFDKTVDFATNTVKNTIELTKNTVTSAIDTAKLSVERAIQSTSTEIRNAISYAKDVANTTANLVKTGIDTTVALAKNTVTDAIATTERLVSRAVDTAKSGIESVIAFTRNGIENISKAVENAVKSAIDFAKNGITSAVSAAIETTRAIGSAIIDAVQRNAAFFVEKATSLFLGVKQQIDSVVENVGRSVENARKMVEDKIRELISFILAKISELMQFADEYYKRIKDFIQEQWNRFYDNLQRGSAVASGEIRNALNILLSGNYSDIDGAISAINNVVGLEEFSRFLLYALAATFIFGNALPAIAAPYLQNITNKINASVLPGTIGIDIIAEAVGRGYLDIDTASNWCGRLGISGAMLNIAVLTAETHLSAQEAVNAYLSGLIDKGSVRDYLIKENRNPDTADILIELARERINASTVFDAIGYGVWSEQQGYDELRKIGYTDDRIEALRASYYTTLSEQDIRELYLRNAITKDERDWLLRRNRYDNRSIELSYHLDNRIPPLADLVRFGVKDVYNEEFVRKYELDEEIPDEFIEDAKKLGLSEKYARYYWRAYWQLPSPTMGYEMFHRGIISREELAFLLKISDYPRFWRDKLIEMAYNPLTRVDVRRMYQLGVMSRDEVKRAYLDLGYNEQHAELLTRFTETLTTSGESDTDETRRLTKNEILRAIRLGIVDSDNARAMLREMGYVDRDIDTLLRLATFSQKPERNENALSDHFNRIRKLVARLYADDYITRETAISMLVDIGYTQENASVEIALVEREDDYNDDEEILRYVRKMYERRVLSENDLRAILRQVIVVPEDKINEIVEKEAFMRDLRSELPTMAEVKQWVKKGIFEREEYEEYLRARGIAERYIPYYLVDIFGREGVR